MTKTLSSMFLKEVLFIEEPANSQLYDYIFVTSSKLKEVLAKRFRKVTATNRQIERWVSADGAWGDKKTHRINKVPQEGRWLWLLTDNYLGNGNSATRQMN